MKNTPQEIPSWLSWPNGVKKPDHNFINESRKEMYEALSLFHNHVKYVIYILVSMLGAIWIITQLWPSQESNIVLYKIGGIILIFVPIVGAISVFVIYRYYQVYVSALVFATKVHIAVGYKNIHPWLERIINQAKEWPEVKNSLDFIKKRAKSLTDTFVLYSIIIVLLSAAGLIFGIILLLI
jgi:hypothetical protein